MTTPHIAEIGDLFTNVDGFKFTSNQNMLEFDFIVIDSDSLRTEANGAPKTLLDRRFNDLLDFVSVKNIPVVFLCSSPNFFADSANIRRTVYSLLGLEVTEERVSGKKIEANKDSVFSDFLKLYASELEYTIGFSRHPGTSIGNAKSKALSIGFYTKDFVFLPTFHEDAGFDDDEYLQELYRICLNIRKEDNSIKLPQWANDYHLPGEKTERQHLLSLEKEIERLQEERRLSQNRLLTYLPLKQLWFASGSNLENAAKLAFSELGFKLKTTEHGRDDIIMQWKDIVIVVEVKGLGKSAAEKNAAQLEKWVSIYISDHDLAPKGMLLVNTFREQSLHERSEASFPSQMLKYSNSRDHCLLTTVQLCNILLYCRENPDKREEIIDQLVQTTGVFEPFVDWKEYIEYTQKAQPTKPKSQKSTRANAVKN